MSAVLKFSEAKATRLYLVGGFLRDIALGRKEASPDIDFTLKKNSLGFARQLAKALKSGFVILDKKNGCARLLKKVRDRVYTLDFTDFRGRDLLEDLRKRDFSINALAAELSSFLKSRQYQLIDPYQGQNDLKRRVVRIITPAAYDDDPLRILRAFSLSAALNFKIDRSTLRLAEKKRRQLSLVSAERIREELFKILANPASFEFLVKLDRHRILDIIFPEIKPMRRIDQGPYHHLDVWLHSLEAIRQLEKIFINFSGNQDIKEYLNREISPGRSRRDLVKLGALLHDFGKPAALRIEEGKIKFHGHEHLGAEMLKEIARRLRFSNCESAILRKLVLHHLRPGYLADAPALTPRARFRFFRDTAEEAIGVLLISLADQRSTKGCLTTPESRRRHERVVRRLIKDYFQRRREVKPARLINGHEIMRRFKLEPSPLIGKILSETEEAQAVNKVRTKQEALSLAEMIIKKEA